MVCDPIGSSANPKTGDSMLFPGRPENEIKRLESLYSYHILDTCYESSFCDIASLAGDLLEAPVSLVSLVDADRQWFKSKIGIEATEAPREMSFCAHSILEPDRLLVVQDTWLDSRFHDNPLVTGDPKFRFYAGAPLVNPEGAALGTLCVMDYRPREISLKKQEILRKLANTIVTTLELRQAVGRLAQLAMVDCLTGLHNRRSMKNIIDSAIAVQRRHRTSFGLVYLDVDGFKTVNDRMGHAAGDEILREVAMAINSAVRREDSVARICGDEFAVVLQGPVADEALAADRIRLAIKSRFSSSPVPITASVGAIRFLSPPETTDSAIAAADALMYHAKGQGRNRVVSATA
jgi:diguanylate cyclase (GGDEF)-like protein